MSPPSFPGIRISRRATTAWLEYHREPINAFDWDMLQGAHEALRLVTSDESVRVIVIGTALPRHFSAGADLRVFEAMPPERMREWIGICHDIVAVLRGSKKPLLACIEGTAVGGGLEIALHCDVRFAASDARMGQPEVNIGFIPPIGATQALARLLGRSRAIRLLYEGTLIDAADALSAGLIDIMAPPGEVRDTVARYAEALAAKPAATLAAIRRCITLGGGATFEEGIALEREAAAALAAHPDFKEGLRAFLEKRAPRWQH